MIKLCEYLGLVVVNGRTKRDCKFEITWSGKWDSSAIEYALIRDNGMENFDSMLKVVARMESDYLFITLELGKEGEK